MADSMDLKTLDGKRVSVSVPIHDKAVVISGIARFLKVPDRGPALQSDVDDPAGAFRLLFIEFKWSGPVAAGHLISLSKTRGFCDWRPNQKYMARGEPSHSRPEA